MKAHVQLETCCSSSDDDIPGQSCSVLEFESCNLETYLSIKSSYTATPALLEKSEVLREPISTCLDNSSPRSVVSFISLERSRIILFDPLPALDGV